jgi:aminoglycoside 3-N-acetyltransferase I
MNHKIMNITISFLSSEASQDFAQLIKIFEVVFEMPLFELPSQAHLQQLLTKKDFWVLVAKHDDKVVGGLTVYVLHRYYSTKPIAYIYDVGVSEAYQRQGIGKKLIAYVNQYCKTNSFEEVYVEAETADSDAVQFYRATPVSHELQATHFTYQLKS